ncbi:MAG: efflux RND transporter periplasmic adaptor subunit [Nitrosomonadaceae bacterium]|jgi:HlyD family secretion protein|nr:efflux RND transporter periplasmic adaptor subunit [Nitrosomonadaceae bacterium]
MPESKILFRFVIFTLIVALLSYAVWFATRPKPIEVELATIIRGTVESTVVNTRAGTVKACRRAKLAPATGGQIIKLQVKEGERVKQGQMLLEIWNSELAAKLELAQQQMLTAEKRRREACIVADNAHRQSRRMRQLVAKNFVSQERSDDADAKALARQASCDALTTDVKRAQAQIQVVQSGLERTVLTAPFAGIVARITGEIGEYATPSPPGIATPPVVDLIDDTCLYVSAPMDEIDAPKLKTGQFTRITLDALPGQVFTGKIRRIAPYVTEVEKQARTVDVEVDFDEPPNLLLLVGYSADVEAVIDRHDDVLRIPAQAIRQKNKVLVLGADSKLEERSVETGLTNWAFTEVINGLEAGDQVFLTSDQDDVKAGTQVKHKVSQ